MAREAILGAYESPTMAAAGEPVNSGTSFVPKMGQETGEGKYLDQDGYSHREHPTPPLY